MIPRQFAANMTLLLRELEFGPSTTRELAYVLQVDRRTVQLHIAELRAAGKVRVSAWERPSTPVYGLGQRDAVRPPPLSSAEIQRRYKARRKDHGK